MASLEPIDFTFRNRHYYIPFLMYPIIQLKGDSSVGKSLFVSDFDNIGAINEKYSNSLIITRSTKQVMPLLESKEYEYVLIDNADLVITPEIDSLIFDRITSDLKTKYVIMGRRIYTCVGSLLGVGSLVRQYDKERDMYEFSVDFMHTF